MVDGGIVGDIGPGLLLLVGMMAGDGVDEVELLANKVVDLRVFEDAQGRMNRSARERVAAGEPCGLLVVSQFTLYGDVRKGRRPSFTRAAAPDDARVLIEQFVAFLRGDGFQVAKGTFGAHMRVALVNDGPVTIWIDSDELRRPRHGARQAGGDD